MQALLPLWEFISFCDSKFAKWQPGGKKDGQSYPPSLTIEFVAELAAGLFLYSWSSLGSKLGFSSTGVTGVLLWIMFSFQYASQERVHSTSNLSAISLQYKLCIREKCYVSIVFVISQIKTKQSKTKMKPYRNVSLSTILPVIHMATRRWRSLNIDQGLHSASLSNSKRIYLWNSAQCMYVHLCFHIFRQPFFDSKGLIQGFDSNSNKLFGKMFSKWITPRMICMCIIKMNIQISHVLTLHSYPRLHYKKKKMARTYYETHSYLLFIGRKETCLCILRNLFQRS